MDEELNFDPVIFAPTEGGEDLRGTVTDGDGDQLVTGNLNVVDENAGDVVFARVNASSASAGLPADATFEIDPRIVVIEGETRGTLTWSFNAPAGSLDFLAAGERSIITYTIEVSDNEFGEGGGSDTIDVVVTAVGTNDAPEAFLGEGDSDTALVRTDQEVVEADGSISVRDADLSDSVISRIVGVTEVGTSSGATDAELTANTFVLVQPDGPAPVVRVGEQTGTFTWQFTPPDGFFEYLERGAATTFIYTVALEETPDTDDTPTTTFSITVANPGEPPEIIVNDGDRTIGDVLDGDLVLQASGTLTVRDPDSADVVRAAVTDVSVAGIAPDFTDAELIAMLALSPEPVLDNGDTVGELTWLFDAPNNAFTYLAEGETTDITYTVEVTDQAGGTDTQTITITATGVDDAPFFGVGEQTGSGDGTESDVRIQTSGTLTGFTPEFSDTLRVEVSEVSSTIDSVDSGIDPSRLLPLLSVPSGLVVGVGPGQADFQWSFDTSGFRLDFLAADELLEITYTILGTDSTGLQGDIQFTFSVTGENDNPSLSAGEGGGTVASVTDGTEPLSVTRELFLFDNDVSDTVDVTVASVAASGVTPPIANADLLALLSLPDNPALPSTATSDDLPWTFAAGADVFNYLAADETTTLTYVLEAEDSAGATSDETITITVTGINEDPVIIVNSDAGDSNFETLINDGSGPLATAFGTLTVFDSDVSDQVNAAVTGVAGFLDGVPEDLTDEDVEDLFAQFTLDDNPLLGDTETSATFGWAFGVPVEELAALSAGQVVEVVYTIEVSDPFEGTDTETVTIRYVAGNVAPDIINDGASGNSASGSVTDGAANLEASGTLTVIDPNAADTVSVDVTGLTRSGAAVPQTDSALLALFSVAPTDILDSQTIAAQLGWIFTASEADLSFLADGETATLNYTITATDSQDESDTQVVAIELIGQNNDPEIAPGVQSFLDSFELSLDAGAASTTGSRQVADADLSDEVNVAVTDVLSLIGEDTTRFDPNDLLPLLTIDSNPVVAADANSGTVNWTFDTDGLDLSSVGGEETFDIRYTITATDSTGATDTRIIRFLISGDNDDPDLFVDDDDDDDAALTDGDTALSASGTLSAEDPDLTDIVTAAVSNVAISGDPVSLTDSAAELLFSLGQNDTVIGNDTTEGKVSWSFDAAAFTFDELAAGEEITIDYTIEVTDTFGATDTLTVSIDVAGVNENPDISVIGETTDAATATISEADPATASATLTISDTDVSDVVNMDVTSVSSLIGESASGFTSDQLLPLLTLSENPVLAAGATQDRFTWSFDSTGIDLDPLSDNQRLVIRYTLTATDSALATDTQTVSIVIDGENDAPVAVVDTGDSTSLSVTRENDAIAGFATLSVADPDNGDTARVEVIGATGSGGLSGRSENDLLSFLSVPTTDVVTANTTQGRFTYIFDTGDDLLPELTGTDGAIDYTLRFTDDNDGQTTTIVTVTVGGNSAPTTNTDGPGDNAETVLEADGTPQSSGGQFSVEDADAADTVTATATAIDAPNSVTDQFSDAELLAFLSVTDTVIAAGLTTGTANWTFNTGEEVIGVPVGTGATLTYTIEVSDGLGGTAEQDVVVELVGTNSPPEASLEGSDTDTLNFEEGLTSNTLFGSATFTATDLNIFDTVTATLIGAEATGALAVLPEPVLLSFVELPDNPVIGSGETTERLSVNFAVSIPQLNNLSEGEVTSVVYDVLLTDSNGAQTTTEFTAIVTGTNDAPTIDDNGDTDASSTSIELSAGPAEASATLSVADPDILDTVTASVSVSLESQAPNPGDNSSDTPLSSQLSEQRLLSFFSIADDEIIGPGDTTGSVLWSFAAPDGALDFLGEGEIGRQDYFITVTDSAGASDVQTVSIRARGDNDGPSLFVDEGGTRTLNLNETDGGVSGAGQLTVADPDNGDAVTVDVTMARANGVLGSIFSETELTAFLTLPSNPVLGATETSTDFTYNFDTTPDALDALADGETNTITYRLTATDNAGATAERTIAVNVTGEQDSVSLTEDDDDSDSANIIEGDAGLSASGTLSVFDADISDVVTAEVTDVLVSETVLDELSRATLLSFFSVNETVIDGSTDSGTLTWRFDSANEPFDFLSAGEAVEVRYRVRVTDGDTVDERDITLAIAGSADQPTAAIMEGDTRSLRLPEADEPLVANATLTIRDPDRSQTVNAGIESVVAEDAFAGLFTTQQLRQFLSFAPGPVVAAGDIEGTLDYTFDSGSETFDFLASGEVGRIVYTVNFTDSGGDQAQRDITVRVRGTNDEPDLFIDEGDSMRATRAEGGSNGPNSASGTLSVLDPDVSNTLTASVTGVRAPSNVTSRFTDAQLLSFFSVTPPAIDGASDGGSITWTFDTNGGSFDFLRSGQTPTLVYTVSVTDGSDTDTQDVRITLNGNSDRPVIFTDEGDTKFVGLRESNSGLTGDGTLSVRDPDAANVVVASVIGARALGGLFGDFTEAELLEFFSIANNPVISSDGSEGLISYVFDSGNTAFDDLRLGQDGRIVYTIEARDSQDLTDTETVTVRVRGRNDRPDLENISNVRLVEGSEGNTLSATRVVPFTDRDLGDSHTLSTQLESAEWSGGDLPPSLLEALAEALSARISNSARDGDGVVRANFELADALIDFIGAGETITVDYDITVTDAAEASDTETMRVVLLGRSDDPTPNDDRTSAAENGPIVRFDVLGNDTDADANDTLSLVSATSASGTLLAIASSGIIAYRPNTGPFDFLSAGETTTDIITYTVEDTAGLTATADVTVTITGVNDPIQLNSRDTSGTVTGGENTISDSGVINFADADRNDAYQITVQPNSGRGAIGELTTSLTTTGAADGGVTGQLTWTYQADAADLRGLGSGESVDEVFTITISDGTDQAVVPVTITVNAEEDAAPIGGDVSGRVTEDTATTTTGRLTEGGANASFVAGTQQGHFGALTLNANGTWRYTLNNNATVVQDLNSGDVRFDAFQVTSASGSQAILSMRIQGTTDDADLTLRIAQPSNSGSSFDQIRLTNTDIDIDGQNTSPSISARGDVTGPLNNLTFTGDNLRFVDIDLGRQPGEGTIDISTVVDTSVGGDGVESTEGLVFTLVSEQGGRTLVKTIANYQTDSRYTGNTGATAQSLSFDYEVRSDAIIITNVVDPLVIDLDGDGLELAPVDDTRFDIDADGTLESVGWVAGDALLAHDVDGSGTIDDGSELFTPVYAGGGFVTGTEALATLDDNADGAITADDAAFSELVVWADDGDGISQASELLSPEEAGISAISLTPTADGRTVAGQDVLSSFAVSRADGETVNGYEVLFDQAVEVAATITDIIGSGSDDVLLGTDGLDRFVLAGGNDTLTGFDADNDTIVLRGVEVASVGQTDDGTHFAMTDGATVTIVGYVADTAAIRLSVDEEWLT